jgi:hypothetical protein
MANGSISVTRLCRRIVETPRRALALAHARHSLQDVSLKLSLTSAERVQFCSDAPRPFWLCIARRRVISMVSIVAQAYRANAKQCLSWAESAIDPENRDAFFALAATWEAAADRIERSTVAQGIRATGESSLRRAAAG